jgi:hypothetical protein
MTFLARFGIDGRYERAALATIFLLLVARLIVSAFFPVFADEAYTLVVTRFPTLSYYDHPPIAFGLPRLAAWLGGSEASYVIRLPHVLLGAASAWLIFLITRRIFGAEAGFWATAAYSTAPYIFISASHFALPEGPLYFFLLLTLWIVLPDLLGEERPRTWRWVVAGLTLGAALLSKYTAALFGISAFVWMVWSPRGRQLLATPGPWITVALATLCTTPIFVWNVQNDWVTLQFQSSRTHGGGFSIVRFLILQGGQAAYLWPWTWALALVATFRAVIRPEMPIERLLGLIAALPILLFGAVSLIAREMLPHWSMPGFVFAFPLVGAWCAWLRTKRPRLLPRLLPGSAVVLLLATILVTVQSNTAALTRGLGVRSDADFDWTSISWDALRRDFEERGIFDDPQAYIVPASWIIGGMAGHALGPAVPVGHGLTFPLHLDYIPDDRLARRSHGYAVDAARPHETDDIVATLGAKKGSRWVVGFARETEDHRLRALAKLERKFCDLIVSNTPAAISSPNNEVEVLTPTGEVIAALAGTKEHVATRIMQIIEDRLVRCR